MSILGVHNLAQFLGISLDRLVYLAERNLVPAPSKILDGHPYWEERLIKGATSLCQKGEIYFVQCEGFIKIGFAGSAKGRLGNLQTSNPHQLTLLHYMSGTLAREGEIAAAFPDLHQRGEWFRAETPLIDFIARVKTRGDRPHQKIRPMPGGVVAINAQAQEAVRP